MTNKMRGSVTIQAGDKEYTLKLCTNAMCDLEDEYNMDIQSLMNSMDPEASGNPPKIIDMRNIVKAMLSDAHPDLSLLDVGRIIDDCGLEACFEKVEEAVVLAFPGQDDESGKPEAVPAA